MPKNFSFFSTFQMATDHISFRKGSLGPLTNFSTNFQLKVANLKKNFQKNGSFLLIGQIKILAQKCETFDKEYKNTHIENFQFLSRFVHSSRLFHATLSKTFERYLCAEKLFFLKFSIAPSEQC